MKIKGKWSVGRLVIGIISIVLFVIIAFQSCAVGVGSTMANKADVSGAFGFIVAVFFLVCGIVGIVTRNSETPSGAIVCCVFYWLSFFLSRIGAGMFGDLAIWGVLAFIFGCVFLFAATETKKGYIIGGSIGAVLFILMMLMGNNPVESAISSGGSGSTSSSAAASSANNGVSPITQAAQGAASDITIAEQVLLDYNGVKITATGYETDAIWGDGVKLLIENNSAVNTGVSCNALVVNGYMVTSIFSETVAPGKKANDTMYLSDSDLKNAGITDVGEIEVYFHLFNGDTYMGIYDAPAAVIKTSAFDSMTTVKADEGTELYNANDIRIVGKYVDENSIWGAGVLLYIENNSAQNVTVQCDDVSVNGFMVTPLFSSTVYSGKMALDDITIMSSQLEENGITKVSEVELTFKIFNADTFARIAETGAIKFNA